MPIQLTSDQVAAAALSGHRMAGLAPDEQAEGMVRQVVDGELTADQVVERLGADLPVGG